MSRRPDIDGRQLLLASALELFSSYGVDAVSIRAVNRAAGLGPASVHYHFGTKDALVEGVLHVFGDQVITGVKERARDIENAEGPVTSRDLVAMLAQPYLELLTTHREDGHAWVRLVSRLLESDPDRILDRPSARSTWAAASKAYPEAAPSAVQRVMRMCFSLLVNQLAASGPHDGRPGHAQLDLELLVDFLSGGLDAALGARGGVDDARTRRTA